MNSKLLLQIVFASVVATTLLAAAPYALADSDGKMSHRGHWAIPIGTESGSLEITEETDRNELRTQAMDLKDVVVGYDNIHKAKLGKAVNDNGQYYLVWKLINYNYDAETDTKIKTIYVLDAATGEQLTDPIIKEGGHCGDKYKSETTTTSGESA